MGSFYQAHRSCIQSTEIKYSTFVRQALLQRKRWPESRNLSFPPCLSCRFISRYCFPFAAATAQSPVMAVEGPGRTKSSTPLDLSCWEITPCSLAGLKEFPAKPYPCCPQLLPERVPDFSSLRGAGGSSTGAKPPGVGRKEEFSGRIWWPGSWCSALHEDLWPPQGHPRELRCPLVLQGSVFGRGTRVAAPRGSCCWRRAG